MALLGLGPGAPDGMRGVPSQNAMAPLYGFTTTPDRGGSVPLPGALGGASGSIQRPGGEWGFASQTIPTTRQYISHHISISQLKQDIGGIGHLVWGCAAKFLKAMQSSIVRGQDASGGGPSYEITREPIKFMCWSSLARHHQSAEGRRLWGTKTNFSKEVGPYFKFYGVNKTPIDDSLGDNDEVALTICSQGRVRIPDFTCVFKERAPVNSHVWVVWVKCVHQPGLLDQDKIEVFKDRYVSKGAFVDADAWKAANSVKEHEKKMKSWGTSVAAAGLGDLFARPDEAGSPGIPEVSGPVEHYWKPCLWFGPRGRRPPEHLYITEDWTGDAERLYLTHTSFGNGLHFQNQELAREAMWPTSDTDKWLESWVKLPHHDVYIGMG